MALMHIRADPLAHFMPTITTDRGTFFCAAPPGMPKELNSLFMFPAHVPAKARRERAAPSDVEGRSPKRARLANDGEEVEVEVGRRDASVARSLGMGSDVFGRNGQMEGGDVSFNGLGAPGDDFQMDMDGGAEFNIDVEGAMEDARRRASKAGSMPAPSVMGDGAPVVEDDRRSRFSTPADGFGDDKETYSDLVCPIAVFDYRPSKESQSQLDEADMVEGPNKDNFSKNTVKALGILRKHLPNDNDATPRRRGQASAEKVASFKKLSEKVRTYFHSSPSSSSASLTVSHSAGAGVPSCGSFFLLRAACTGNEGLREAAPGGQIREHRGPSQTQDVGGRSDSTGVCCTVERIGRFFDLGAGGLS